MLFGRERESARITEVLDAASAAGGALVVRGEAGIGKSVAERGHRSVRGMQVLARAAESEVDVAYSACTLLRPALVDRQFRTRRQSPSVRHWRSLRTPSPNVSPSSAAA